MVRCGKTVPGEGAKVLMCSRPGVAQDQPGCLVKGQREVTEHCRRQGKHFSFVIKLELPDCVSVTFSDLEQDFQLFHYTGAQVFSARMRESWQLVDSGYLFKNLCLAATALPHASNSARVIFYDAYCECFLKNNIASQAFSCLWSASLLALPLYQGQIPVGGAPRSPQSSSSEACGGPAKRKRQGDGDGEAPHLIPVKGIYTVKENLRKDSTEHHTGTANNASGIEELKNYSRPIPEQVPPQGPFKERLLKTWDPTGASTLELVLVQPSQWTVPAIQEDDGKCGPWGGRQTVLGSGKSKKVPEQEDCTGVAQRAKARLQNERADFLPQSPLPPSPGEASEAM
ncbi:putative G-protein coupled receptor 63 [Manis javanica]|nr:putative G-protein coupled receptor 63 [Manis javanica]